jgi:hypothetical protein
MDSKSSSGIQFGILTNLSVRGPGVSRNTRSDEVKPQSENIGLSVQVDCSQRMSTGEDKSVQDPLDKVPWTDG